MPLDPVNTITKWQSGTVRHCVAAIIVNLIVVVCYLTGKAIDPAKVADVVGKAVDNGTILLPFVWNIWCSYKARRGRIAATKRIAAPGDVAVAPPPAPVYPAGETNPK